MFKLIDIFTIDYLPDLKLLTIPESLQHRSLEHIDITETPDIEFFVSPNTLILTTCMIFKDKQEDLIPFIDSLIRAKVAGLAIKSGRFLGGEIAPEVIAHANAKNFPIINIPDKYPLGILLHQLTNYMWDQKKEEIEFALEIQGKFSHLLLDNASIQTMLNDFSRIIKCPIILLNPFKRVLTYSNYFNQQKGLLGEIETAFQKFFRDKKIPDDYVSLPLGNSQKNAFISISKVFIFKYFPHYLLILNPENMSYPISTFAIDQAQLVLSFALYKQAVVNDTYIQTLSSYYLESFQNEERELSLTPSAIRSNQFLDSNYYVAIEVNEVDALKPLGRSLQLIEKYALITNWFNEYGAEYFDNLVILQSSSQTNPFIVIQENTNTLEDKLKAIRNDLKALINIDLLYSIGETVNSLKLLNRSVHQAHTAFETRRIEQNAEPIVYYNNSGVQHLFHSIDNQDMTYFCESVLKELAYPSQTNLIELRETLKVYLDNQCETTATANQLFVHRNTIKYRIEKCEEILGTSIHDPKNSLNLRVALSMSQ